MKHLIIALSSLGFVAHASAQTPVVPPREPLSNIFEQPDAVGFIGPVRPTTGGRAEVWGVVLMKDSGGQPMNGIAMLTEIDCTANTSRVLSVGRYFQDIHMGDSPGADAHSTPPPMTPRGLVLTAGCHPERIQRRPVIGITEARAAADAYFANRP